MFTTEAIASRGLLGIKQNLTQTHERAPFSKHKKNILCIFGDHVRICSLRAIILCVEIATSHSETHLVAYMKLNVKGQL